MNFNRDKSSVFSSTGVFIFLAAFIFLGISVILSKTVENIALLMGFVFMIAFVVSFLITSWLKKNLDDIKYLVDRINKNDLISDVDRQGNGFTNEIFQNLIITISELKKNFKSQVEVATAVSDIGQKLSEISCESSKTMDAISSSSEVTSENSEKQSDMLQKVTSRAENIVFSLNRMDKEMDETVAFTSKSIASTEKGIESTVQVQNKMKITRDMSVETAEKVNGLKKSSEDIVKLLSLISALSNQTNMLALNASIEAARAGEHGLGFAVVADEVRKLSNETSNISHSIEAVIKNIQNEVNLIGESMTKETTDMEESYRMILKNIDDFYLIKDSLRESLARINDMSNEIKKVNQSGQDIAKDITKATNFSKEISSLMQENTAAVILQNQRELEIQKVMDKLRDESNYMLEYVTSKVMEGKMLREVQHIKKWVENNKVNNDSITKLCKETGMDIIYITDEKGVVKHCNDKQALGLNLYDVDSSFSALRNGSKKFIATPIKKRIEDDELYKFLAIVNEKGAIYEVGLSMNSLLQF